MATIGSTGGRSNRDRLVRGRARLAALIAGVVLVVVAMSPAAPASGAVVPGPPQDVWLEWDLEITTVYLQANPDGLAVEHVVRLETVPPDAATTQERRVSPSAAGVWFDGLELGRTYAVQVWAVSADGTLSEPVVPTGSPFTVAPPVESLLEVSATAPAPDTIEVTWVPNPEAPSPLEFMVDIRKDPESYDDGHVEEGIAGTARSFTWSDAEPATTYFVSVAVSDPSSPLPSLDTTVTTPEAGPPPPAPLAVTATVAGTTMTVAWTPDSSGPAPERYRVRASSGRCALVRTWVAGTSSSADLAVERDCEYEVTVTALASDGAPSAAVVAEGSPIYVPYEPPLDVAAVASSAHQVLVSWRTEDPRAPGQVFRVRIWAPDGTGPQQWTTTATQVTTGWWEAETTLVVRVASCGAVTDRCGPWVPEAGVAVTLPTDLGTLSGTVTGPDGSPLVGATVQGYADEDSWLPSVTATTGADGTYTLVDVAPARYKIRVAPPAGSPLVAHWYPGTTSRRDAASVVVEGGRTYPDIDVAFTAPRPISGRITAAGAPVADALVMAYTPTDRWAGSFATRTSADGTFRVEVLGPTASVRIVAIGPAGSGLEPRWYSGARQRASATPVDTTSGPVTGIDIDWPVDPGISGVVTGAGGAPLAGARVSVYRPTDGYVGYATVTSGTDGAYSIDRLDPGTYLVLVRPSAGSGATACWYGGVVARADATPVTYTGVPLTGIDTSCPAG
jgi:hypothetical protein